MKKSLACKTKLVRGVMIKVEEDGMVPFATESPTLSSVVLFDTV